MKIQVNTDKNIEADAAMLARVEAMVTDTLGHVSQYVTRVEVHISDANSGKGGHLDKLCMMEARPENQKPMAVTDKGASVEDACAGAAKKLRSLLESHFDKLHDVKGAASLRDNPRR